MQKEERALQSKRNSSDSHPGGAIDSSLEQRITQETRAAIAIPLSVLATGLAPATAIAHHLRTHHSLSYADIARALNRDQRTIWTLINRNSVSPSGFSASNQHIPLDIFKNRTLSILEHTVKHLREKGMSLRAISLALKRHPSTISTAHQRAQRKLQ